MSTKLQGLDTSLWVGTTEQTDYPSLEVDKTTYDVVVVGGGITGVVLAFRLQNEGKKVALVERARIVEWTTGSTTAKLSSQHYLIYDYLIKRHGQDVAQAFADANQNGIEDVFKISRDLGIDCDLSRRDAYVFTRQSDKVQDIKQEVVSAKRLGLPASFETAIGLPFEVAGAIKFTGQAQFHPRKFLLALADQFVKFGGVIYEHTNATDIIPGRPHTIVTDKGNLLGESVVQASGEPFWRNEIFAGRMWVKMSYALAVKLKNPANYPQGMYITTDHPMRTIRSALYRDEQVMIFGGESHEYDEKSFDADEHYRNLIEDVQQRFEVDEILYRWLAGDFMPYDRIPFIGPDPEYPSVYTLTGYRAWGLAWAMSGAQAIASYINGKPADWAKHFSLDRLSTPLSQEDKTQGF